MYRFLAVPGVEITNLAFASDEVWFSWKLSVEVHVLNLPHTNEVIYYYISAGARIHLYRFLDWLHENAMYCDTDSFIFIQPSGEPSPIATRDKLGDIQSELLHLELIIEFASGGRSFAYRMITNESEKTVCKFRGITLNNHSSKLVNFEVIRAMILGQVETLLMCTRSISSNAIGGQVGQ
jgi:hypothetical protein